MIRTEQSHLLTQAQTHPGMTGKNNEDRYAVSAYLTEANHGTASLLAVLADGIGGHKAGEVAAEMVVEAVSRKVAASDGRKPTQILQQAIVEASSQVYAHTQENEAMRGMGSTCVCAWIIGLRLYVASVGDSRIYLIRNGQIRQVTTDHTWVQEAVDKGILKPDQIEGHPNAHVIRRFVGSPTPPEVDLRLRLSPDENELQAEANQGLLLKEGDQVLLCSDGLTDLVKDQEILEHLGAYDQHDAIQRLVTLACERGGYDNITVIAIKVPKNVSAAQKKVVKTAGRRNFLIMLGCGTVFMVLLLLGLFSVLMGWLNIPGLSGSPTPAQASVTLPAVLQTFFPEASLTPTPPSTPTGAIKAPQTPTPEVTYTPWPTNTLAPVTADTPAYPSP